MQRKYQLHNQLRITNYELRILKLRIIDLLSIFGFIFSWHRIISETSPRMTRADSFYGHPTTSEDPPLFYRFNRILRTRRVIPTIRRKYWTDNNLIQPNQ